jgi:hypothetical protein
VAALPCFSEISAPLRPRQEPWFLVHVLDFPGALHALQGPYMHLCHTKRALHLCRTAVGSCWCICDAAADSRRKQVQGIPHQPHPCAGFDSSQEYLYQDCLHGLEGRPVGCSSRAQQQADPGSGGEDSGGGEGVHHGPQWAYLRFSQPVTAPADSLVIGSRLDTDLQGSSCRRAEPD